MATAEVSPLSKEKTLSNYFWSVKCGSGDESFADYMAADSELRVVFSNDDHFIVSIIGGRISI